MAHDGKVSRFNLCIGVSSDLRERINVSNFILGKEGAPQEIWVCVFLKQFFFLFLFPFSWKEGNDAIVLRNFIHV